jgi:transcriptional regulator with XRE-family HTH domain
MDPSCTNVIEQILAAGKSRGLEQKVMAAAANIPTPSLSRLKRRGGNPSFAVVQSLARAAGMELRLVDQSAPFHQSHLPHPTHLLPFREKYAHLAWSNSKVSDQVLLRKALETGRFTVLADAFVEFGADALEQEWNALLDAKVPRALAVREHVETILRNMRHGCEKAQAGHREAVV